VPDRRERIRRKINRIDRLHAQADRARKIAAECGFELLAELFETHAMICDTNAKAPDLRKRKLHGV